MRMLALVATPTILREYASVMNAVYANPDRVRT